MKSLTTIALALLMMACQINGSKYSQSIRYKNIWTQAPQHIPNNVSIDAPLMGNGDLTLSVGYEKSRLRYYLSKNDFWRLQSQADGLSGPRVVGFVDINLEESNPSGFAAEQEISNGITTCTLANEGHKVETRSWVQATDNLIIIQLVATGKPVSVTLDLTAPENQRAILKTGTTGDIDWLTRSFTEGVDMPTEVSVALKKINYSGNSILLELGKELILVIAVESKFKEKAPLEFVQTRVREISKKSIKSLLANHNKWWGNYWEKSSVSISDTVLMKAYYQGLYTMAACSRDTTFPPGIFGWTSTDTPAWNGDYHLNYNFQAPFYSLCSSNRLEQAVPHDAPLIDFMPRGTWYAENVTHTRGILYPVGIGPLGIEVTRNFEQYRSGGNMEMGGLFFGQRSNAAYGLINMAQYWRCTYDRDYGKKIYPYALAVADFWEDYLKLEDGRYVIYGDAIHEGSGKDKNPILTLGLLRNAFELMLDLSSELNIDRARQDKWREILSHLSDFPVQVRNGKKVFRYTEEGVDWWNDNGLGIQHIYPANAITPGSSKELLEVARNTIDEMQRWHDTNTSNSFFAAAVRVGYDPAVILKELHKYALHTYPNGFQLGNPHGIENSCTVANALNEMLCMSVGHVIRLFSAFPSDQDASFTNLRTWGAFLVSARLESGVISGVRILSEKGKSCTLINPWPDRKIQLIRNGKKAEILAGEKLLFTTSENETIKLQVL